MQRRWKQALSSGAQWAWTKIQKVPSAHHELLLCYEGDWVLNRLSREVAVSLLGGIQKLSEKSPRLAAPSGPAWAGELDQKTSRHPFLPSPLWDSMSPKSAGYLDWIQNTRIRGCRSIHVSVEIQEASLYSDLIALFRSFPPLFL